MTRRLDMACGQGSIPRLVLEVGGLADGVSPLVADAASPALFVSNSPEQLFAASFGQAQAINLCRAEIVDATFPRNLRFFIWHVNKLDEPVTIALLVSGAFGPMILKRQLFAPPNATLDLATGGICIAEAHLAGTLDQVNVTPTIVGNESVIWSHTLAAATQNLENGGGPYRIVGALLEFSVPAGDFTIRTVATKQAGQYGTFATPAATHGISALRGLDRCT